jgi:hypothetical protein
VASTTYFCIFLFRHLLAFTTCAPQELVRQSIRNLMQYPFVRDAVVGTVLRIQSCVERAWNETV